MAYVFTLLIKCRMRNEISAIFWGPRRVSGDKIKPLRFGWWLAACLMQRMQYYTLACIIIRFFFCSTKRHVVSRQRSRSARRFQASRRLAGGCDDVWMTINNEKYSHTLLLYFLRQAQDKPARTRTRLPEQQQKGLNSGDAASVQKWTSKATHVLA